jgi:hypothetical protein
MGKPNFSDDFKRDAVHQITVGRQYIFALQMDEALRKSCVTDIIC